MLAWANHDMTRKIVTKKQTKSQLDKTLLDLQIETNELPQLSPVEKAKFEHTLAIDQLYYSSKIEGTTLSKEMIDKAINGKRFPMA